MIPRSIAIRFAHWASAVVLMFVLALAFTHELPESGETSRLLLGWHQRLGLFIGVLLVLRLLARALERDGTQSAELPVGLRMSATLSHALLYLLLAALPLIGWTMVSARGRDVSLVPGGRALPHLVATDTDFADTLQTWHERGAWVLICVIALHALAALWHHHVRGDDVLTRMWPSLSRRKSIDNSSAITTEDAP